MLIAACLRMVLLAFGVRDVPGVKDLMAEGVRLGLFRESAGWLHQGIASAAQRYGLEAIPKNLDRDPSEVVRLLDDGRLLIASVSLGFQPRKRGGHLIVVCGAEVDGERIVTLDFRDPSGWGQTHSEVGGEDFLRSWAVNLIIVGLCKRKRGTMRQFGPILVPNAGLTKLAHPSRQIARYPPGRIHCFDGTFGRGRLSHGGS